MMKLKKLAAMMAAAAMVFSLAACGGKSNTVESKSVENAAEETKMCIRDSVGIGITNLKPGCGGSAVQFLEPERNYLPGRHRGADCGNYAWNHANPGIAAGGT